jgi:hypothetical protein
MRFRAKFGILDWARLALGSFVVLLYATGSHHATRMLGAYAVVWTVIITVHLLLRAFIFWDVFAVGLHERRLWSSRTILWNQISSVEPWPDNRSGRSSIAIDFSSPAPLSTSGRVVANPGRLDEFLAALRRYAPQASISVPSSSTLFPSS